MKQQSNEHAFTTMQAAAPATVKKVSKSATKDNVENWAKIEAKTESSESTDLKAKTLLKRAQKFEKEYRRIFGLFLLKKSLRTIWDENLSEKYASYLEFSNGGRLRRAGKDETANAVQFATHDFIDKDGNEKTEKLKVKRFVKTDDVDYRDIIRSFADFYDVKETQENLDYQKEKRLKKEREKTEKARAERANVLKSVTAADISCLDPAVLESLKKLLNA